MRAQEAREVRVAIRAPGGEYAGRVLREAGMDMLRKLHLRGELSVALVTDSAIRRLNREWRRIDRPTDVLSFPQEDEGAAGAGVLGDVAISLDTARRQAREGGWTVAAELRRLLAHGLLHCLGHDHGVGSQARRMAAAERRLLGREGMVGEAEARKLPLPPARARKRRLRPSSDGSRKRP
jgi:probable rRNA maturation factor